MLGWEAMIKCTSLEVKQKSQVRIAQDSRGTNTKYGSQRRAMSRCVVELLEDQLDGKPKANAHNSNLSIGCQVLPKSRFSNSYQLSELHRCIARCQDYSTLESVSSRFSNSMTGRKQNLSIPCHKPFWKWRIDCPDELKSRQGRSL